MEDALRREARQARSAVVAGALRGDRLLASIAAVSATERDGWVDELLGVAPPPPDVDLPRGAVPYLPAGVDEILALVREAPVNPDDTLIDIGAGLGRAAILAHLLSGARTLGVEIQAPLAAQARARCAALGLDAVSVIHANAADIALDGSVIFLYAPCNGELLARVVRRIEDAARRRRIVVATVGLELPGVAWLDARAAVCPSLMLYDSSIRAP